MQYNGERLPMTLKDLRTEIDDIDNKLLLLIGKRIEVVKKIGELKKATDQPIRDEKREEEKIEALVTKNQNVLLNKERITKIWKAFFEVAYTVEE